MMKHNSQFNFKNNYLQAKCNRNENTFLNNKVVPTRFVVFCIKKNEEET